MGYLLLKILTISICPTHKFPKNPEVFTFKALIQILDKGLLLGQVC